MNNHEDPRYIPHEQSDVAPADYEHEPITRQEYIAAMVHFYRGELQRTLEWRKRMDTTTHWALLTTVGIVTFSFSNPHYAQETLITGMYANFMFLMHESRRFRFFDMWRSRLRMVEENFYGPIMRRDPHSPIQDWGDQVAEDLLHPKFKITRLQAMRARLKRNYSYIYVFLLLAYLGRAFLLPSTGIPVTLPGLFSIGPIPWWIPLALVAGLYSFLVGLMLFTPNVRPIEEQFLPDVLGGSTDVPTIDS
jgi:uncharacterized membrane protein